MCMEESHISEIDVPYVYGVDGETVVCSGQQYYPEVVTDANAALIALAPALAAEVIRLRAQLDERYERTMDLEADCRKMSKAQHAALYDAARFERERDEARKEAADLREQLASAKADAARICAVLDAPENAGKGVSELYEALWGKLPEVLDQPKGNRDEDWDDFSDIEEG